MAHHPAMDLLFLIGLCRFHGLDAQVADWLVKSATFAVVLASEPVACHAAILQVGECNRAPFAKFLPYWQHLGRCQMHQWMTYIH